MINRKTLAHLAGLTFVLLLVCTVIGPERDVLWIGDDLAWYAFLVSALALIVLSVGVLAKSRRPRR